MPAVQTMVSRKSTITNAFVNAIIPVVVPSAGEIEEALRTAEDAVEMARRSPSSVSQRVLSTYANILLARDPKASEAILRSCLDDVAASPELGEARHTIEINLGMALVLRAYRLGAEDQHSREMLAEARELLTRVFSGSFQVGRYPNAGAAALMIGIVSALDAGGDEVSWFAQAVAAASRGHKMETLWRAHINLATATYQRDETVSEGVRDHAGAALEIMEETLSPYAQADRSARFDLIRMPLSQAVRFLLVAGDDAGMAALIRYPELRNSFRDLQAGILREDHDGERSHEWLRIGGEDYVIY